MASGAGPEQKLDLPIKKDVHLSVGLLEILSAGDLKPGDSRTFTVFDPITATERSVRFSSLREETILVMDREERAKKVSVEFMGVSQYAWIGKDGAALREEGPLESGLSKWPRGGPTEDRRFAGDRYCRICFHSLKQDDSIG